MSPLVSVIVVNWNGERLLHECLQSVLSQTHQPMELIVVDNGSTDRSLEILKGDYKESVCLVENSENLGFAGGNNAGIRVARGKYIALLNNDAVADPLWLGEMVKTAEADPTVGMFAVKIYSYDQPGILDSAGGLLIYPDGLSRGRGRMNRDHGQFDCSEEVLLPSGCACMYRRSMLDEIGLFDEDFFAYSEDVDLGLRARMAGWKCQHVPSAVVRHHYSASTGKYSLKKAFLVERNRIWVVVKNFPVSMILLSPFYTAWRIIFHGYAVLAGEGVSAKFVVQSGPGAMIRTIMNAYLSALRSLPRMWRKRRKNWVNLKGNRRDIRTQLRTFKLQVKALTLKD